MKHTPIYICSKDRYSFLRKLIERLEKADVTNIIIVDTGSTYPPILEYYASLKYPITYLGNVPVDAHHALWNYNVLNLHGHQNDWFVWTDPDVVPTEECPNDFMELMYDALMRFPGKVKAGFGFKLDDIPEHYQHKYTKPGEDKWQHPGIMDWEPQFFSSPLAPHLYDAPIDTTFALYRPGVVGNSGQPAIRTGDPYLARHLAWYCNSSSPTEEELYYKAHVTKDSSSWGL